MSWLNASGRHFRIEGGAGMGKILSDDALTGTAKSPGPGGAGGNHHRAGMLSAAGRVVGALGGAVIPLADTAVVGVFSLGFCVRLAIQPRRAAGVTGDGRPARALGGGHGLRAGRGAAATFFRGSATPGDHSPGLSREWKILAVHVPLHPGDGSAVSMLRAVRTFHPAFPS